jgi:hypothetical protein
MIETNFKRKRFIIDTLRRASFKWKPRGEAMASARVARGKYRCAMCKNEHFGPKEVRVDHIMPVVDTQEGFTSWDSYIQRMFCEIDGLQVLCKQCHDIKTEIERSVRKAKRQEEKERGDEC